MKIGFARADITPRVGISLCGYGYYLDRNSESVHDALYANVMVFRKEDKGFILINYDLIGLKVETVKILKERLVKEFGGDDSLIMVAATHTHSGPNTGLSRCVGEPCSPEYLSMLIDSTIQVTRSAWNGASQVTSLKGFIDPTFEGIGFNRVLPDVGPVDSSLGGIVFYREGYRPLALINYACHPVVLGCNKEIAADYPGAVVAAMDEAGYDAIFLNGFCGDIDPLSNRTKWGSGTYNTIREYGRRIAQATISGLSDGSDLGFKSVDIKGISTKASVPLEVFDDVYLLNFLKEAREGLTKEGANSVFRAKEEWAQLMLEQIRSGELKENGDIEIAVIKIGDLFMVGLPGEVYTEIGMMIRRAYPHRNIFTLGNTNGSIGYIPTNDDIERKGYGGYSSSWVYDRQPFLPGVAERLVDETVQLLTELGAGYR